MICMSLWPTLTVRVLCDPGNSCVRRWVTGHRCFFLKPTHCVCSFSALRYRPLCAHFCACKALQLAVSFSVCHHCPEVFTFKEAILPFRNSNRKGSCLGIMQFIFSYCVDTDKALVTRRTVFEKPTNSAQYSHHAQTLLFTVSRSTLKKPHKKTTITTKKIIRL